MFRLTKSDHAAPAIKSRNALRRALLLAGALLLLWFATRLIPGSTPPPYTEYSDDAGALAAHVDLREDSKPRPLVGPGYLLVLLILAGGAAFAFYLHRKNTTGSSPENTLRVLGQLQFAPGQQLRLVACGDDVLLLGVTSGQITLLKTYPSSSFNYPTPDKEGSSRAEEFESALSTPNRMKQSFSSVLGAYTRDGHFAQEGQR
jgi:flagellar protein FliO/FliZ